MPTTKRRPLMREEFGDMLMRETRLLLHPRQVEHLHLTCSDCNEVSMYRVAGSMDVPEQCPHCRASWLVEGKNLASELMSALRPLAAGGASYYIELGAPDDDTG